MAIYEFKKSLEFGKKGEDFIWMYLQKQTNVCKLWDVRNNEFYQKIDIDFISESENGTKNYIEVKTDSYTSGNIYYEVLSSANSDGCMYKTKADTLYYYYPNMSKLYIFDLNKFRDFVESCLDWFDFKGYKKSVKNYSGNGMSTYESIGYAIPLSLFHMMEPKWMEIITF
ncbi:hypothetical protein [Enterococcus sp. DIV1059_2]|uniref:hypothetical protein n=1 Tax=Enterococcus sp. DIV1059_2 TaxID=2774664 RepID=UPI003F2860B8